MNTDNLSDFTRNISIRDFYLNIFNIRRGELRRVVLMQINIFLLIATVLVIKPTINSLFLSDVGIEKLPHAFVLVAVTAGIITSFYSRLLNRLPLNRIILFTLLISVLAISSFSVLLKLNLIDKTILYIFYAWVAVFGVLATSQFWILANIVFNAREAKRLFSLIGGAAIGGGIFGGYLTSLLAPRLGSENLLFLGVIFLIICIPLTHSVWKSNAEITRSVIRRKQRMGRVSERPHKLILNSRHLTYLALITAIGVLVAKLVDYQFSAISAQKIANEDDLTAFFGFWYSNFNILSLLIQLFLTRRIVGVYGVGVSLFFLPAGILIGALAILISPGLGPALIIKAGDGSLKQSVNKSAMELLALPIPGETKKQAKTFIDVFIDSFATGLSGILLIAFVNAFNIPVRFVSLLIIALLVIWIRLIVRVRAEYISQFKDKLNLPETSGKKASLPLDLSNVSVYNGIRKVLEEGTESQILYLLRNTDDIQHEKLFEPVRKLIAHPSPAVVTQAIKKLYHYKTQNLSSEIQKFTASPDTEIRVAAIEYLIEHAQSARMEVIQNYLLATDDKTCLAAMLAFASETRDNPVLQEHFRFSFLVEEKLKGLEEYTDQADREYAETQLLKIIGTANLRKFYPHIQAALHSGSPERRMSGIRAAALTLEKNFCTEILALIVHEQIREDAITAVARFGFRIIDHIRELVNQERLEPAVLYSLPAVIEKIGTQYAVDYLFELLEYKDLGVRNKAVLSLTRLKTKSPHLNFYNKQIVRNIYEEAKLFLNTLTALYVQQETLNAAMERDESVLDAGTSLINLLERRLDDNLERIFRFLGLKYPPDEIDTIYREIRSEKKEMRINAVEFLDNLLDTHLKRLLIPIIETSLAETITREVLKELNIKIVSQQECFTMLLEGRDLKVKLAVLYLLGTLKDKKLLPLVSNYVNDPEKKIRTFALKAIRAMSEKDEDT